MKLRRNILSDLQCTWSEVFI